MARPAKLTPESQQLICEAIAAGNYYESACSRGGISFQTFCVWMSKGEAGTSPYREFRDSVLKAVAESEMKVVESWQAHMPENWQACRDFLARRFPKRWGEKQTHEVSGGDTPIKVEVTVSEPDRLAALHRLYARLGGGTRQSLTNGHAAAE